ncbi:hypothetical protein Tco_0282685 [Tanacetum coccineum]
MALISLSFKKIYKPTNNNLRTSSNTSRANQDNSPRINRGTVYDNQGQSMLMCARENVGTPYVQKLGFSGYNYKEYGHVSRECQKPKRVKDAAYHKEKMLLCKQEEELGSTLYVTWPQHQEVTPDQVGQFLNQSLMMNSMHRMTQDETLMYLDPDDFGCFFNS